MIEAVHPPTDVPAEDEHVRCPYCDRPFQWAERRDLHVGEVHEGAMSEDERSAYGAAVESERDEMWLYHFKIVVVLLVLYMLTGLLYLVTLG